MKTKLIKKSVSGLILYLFFANYCLAGDTFSIPVSCTIPAIPGVNVPLIESESVRAASENTQKTDEQTAMIEENAQTNPTSFVVKTMYDK